MKNGIILLLSCLLFSCAKEKEILFQDDFESGNLQSVWTKSGAGTISLDTEKSYSGKQSVHFVSGEGYQNRAFLSLEHLFPILGNHFSGRLKMYVEEASKDGIHWTIIEGSGKVANANYSSEVRYGGQHHKQFMANYDTKGVKTDCWQHSQTKIPEKEWMDLQWEFDGPKNTMRFWLNDALINEITVVDKGEGCVQNDLDGVWQFPIFEKLSLGWVDYQSGGGTRNVWIDDVVVYKN